MSKIPRGLRPGFSAIRLAGFQPATRPVPENDVRVRVTDGPVLSVARKIRVIRVPVFHDQRPVTERESAVLLRAQRSYRQDRCRSN